MPKPPAHSRSAQTFVFWIAAALALYSAVMPCYRAAMLLEIDYNEGWNAYSAAALAQHAVLYPAGYQWTVVNYPVLSFFTLAHLGSFTHEYLFTGRVLSLLSLALCCVFAGIIVHRLTRSGRSDVLAGLLCLLIFCANAAPRVGVDDPQMFAQAFFMAGLLVYVLYRDEPWALVAVALLFVAGGNIKHNLIDFPLAVALDLYLVSRRRLAAFAGLLILFELPAFYLNVQIGGSGFVTSILIPRPYLWARALPLAFDYYVFLLVPMGIAIVAAVRAFREPERRIIAIFFAVSLAVGMFFAGGLGVSPNTFFSNTLATVILLGLFMHDAGVGGPQWKSAAAVLAVFFWMLFPLQCKQILFPQQSWDRLHARQQRFGEQVEFLRRQPGPALCESLLRCYYADKPYLVDPFNSTTLVRLGKLDENVLVSAIRAQRFGAIQFDQPPRADGLPDAPPERFTTAELEAVRDNYAPVFKHSDCTIYVPLQAAERAASK